MDAPADSMRIVRTAVTLLVSALVAADAATPPGWHLLQSPHFEVYSQGDETGAQSTLLWFEQLRAFFVAAGLELDARPPVRVIGFQSVREYNVYRLRATADAYYVGTETRDYIVMPSLGESEFRVAAHEYAHLVLRASGFHLPPWLNEGLAEFFSTVRITSRECQIGGAIRSHTELLRHRSWMPLERLFTARPESLPNREETSLFYAQSWALTEMLVASPEYRPRFPELVAALRSGAPASAALTKVFGRSLDAITADMQTHFNRAPLAPVTVPGVAVGSIKVSSSPVSTSTSRSVLAELLSASGELDRAATLYRELARESPRDPDIAAALGNIALRKDNPWEARRKWKEAIREGVTDANLCYRYAALADDAGVPANEILPALERAVALKPDFDDARFKLALLEANASDYELALGQLQAMRRVAPSRAFVYWIACASAQDELGRHDEAKASAQKALAFATTPAERTQAAALAYVADTELTVQFTRDPSGNPQIVTTRVPRGTRHWNPFIEPGDHMRRAEGHLRSVQCDKDKVTGVAVDTTQGSLQLAIIDPLHILVSGATEFTCGPQPSSAVTVEYATAENRSGDGVLRGIEIRTEKQLR